MELKIVSVLEIKARYHRARYKTLREASIAVSDALIAERVSRWHQNRGSAGLYKPHYDYAAWSKRFRQRVDKVMQHRYGHILK